jgi:hypothetical protein
MENHSAFTMKLARPQMYKIAWEAKSEQASMSFSMKGAAWSDGESRFVNVAGQTMQPADMETALAMATGVSFGAAYTIPSIFFDLLSNGITTASNAVLAGGELVEGDDCYVVKVHTDGMDRTLWISKATRFVRQQMTVTSGNKSEPELSDSDARHVLELMGQEVTEEAVRTLREQMASTKEFMKSVKSTYSIEIQREIRTNDPMAPGDFRQ